MDNIERELESQLSQSGVKTGSKRFLDMLHDLFEPEDDVVIYNPFNKKIGWIYSRKTTIQQVDKETQRAYHERPQIRTLEPKTQVVIRGWEAYIALTRTWKQYAQETFAGESMSAKMKSTANKQAFIDMVYKGKYDPNAELEAEEEVPTPTEAPVEEKPAPKETKAEEKPKAPAKKTSAKKEDKKDLNFAEE